MPPERLNFAALRISAAGSRSSPEEQSSWRRGGDSFKFLFRNYRRFLRLGILASIYAGFKHIRTSVFHTLQFLQFPYFREKGYQWYQSKLALKEWLPHTAVTVD